MRLSGSRRRSPQIRQISSPSHPHHFQPHPLHRSQGPSSSSSRPICRSLCTEEDGGRDFQTICVARSSRSYFRVFQGPWRRTMITASGNHGVVHLCYGGGQEEMESVFDGDGVWKETLRVKRLIRRHFEVNGASAVQNIPPDQFCRRSFVIGKASEAGFGNEMYKILTAAALSIMLNRSLIIGQTRGKYPFGEYISYTNQSFSLKEVKHLWRKNGCMPTYGRDLVVRIGDFQKPAHTHILCSNWRRWNQPIIWIQNTTDAVAAQFFLKNIHPDMRKAAEELFGSPEVLGSRPNVFGELMRVLISPSESIQVAVQSVLAGSGGFKG